ncbi:MAG: hypothetical protein ACI8RZ_007976 [Myxococcota bacterium]|jgi:hypothetical protein
MNLARKSEPRATRPIPPLPVYLGQSRLTQAVRAGLIGRVEGREMWRGWGWDITEEKVEAVLAERRFHRSGHQPKGRRIDHIGRGGLPGMTDQEIQAAIDETIATTTPEERADALLWIGGEVETVDRPAEADRERVEGILRLPVRQSGSDPAVDGVLDAVGSLLDGGELGSGETDGVVVEFHCLHDVAQEVEKRQHHVGKKLTEDSNTDEAPITAMGAYVESLGYVAGHLPLVSFATVGLIERVIRRELNDLPGLPGGHGLKVADLDFQHPDHLGR